MPLFEPHAGACCRSPHSPTSSSAAGLAPSADAPSSGSHQRSISSSTASNGRAPLRVADVVFQDPALRADIGRYCPDFEYLLQDLSRYEDHDLQGTALAQMMLLLLKHVRDPDLPRLLPRWTQVMLGVLSSTGLIGVRLVLQYLVEATDTVSAPDLVGWLREITSAGAQEEVMTLAQQWLDEGIEKGRRQTLLRLVALRFGEVPEAAESRIGAAGPAELDRWEERLLFAASLEEMLEQ